MPSVVIIDYNLGNLHSVMRACAHAGIDAEVSGDPAMLLNAKGAILPGVGAFGDAMTNLRHQGLDAAIRRFIDSGRPFMGVCLGLQLLFESSEEFGSHEGLGVIRGVVKRLPVGQAGKMAAKIPHVGWNSIESSCSGDWMNSPLRKVRHCDSMYFVHSYYVEPLNSDDVLSRTTYGDFLFCSSVQRGSVFASQFHPEKSGASGLSIYRQWGELVSKDGFKS